MTLSANKLPLASHKEFARIAAADGRPAQRQKVRVTRRRVREGTVTQVQMAAAIRCEGVEVAELQRVIGGSEAAADGARCHSLVIRCKSKLINSCSICHERVAGLREDEGATAAGQGILNSSSSQTSSLHSSS